MRQKNKFFKRLFTVIFSVFVLSGLVYGVSSITYANTSEGSPNIIVTIKPDGSYSCDGNLFGNSFWYPGYEESGIIRIVNNYKKAGIGDLALNVDLLEFQPDLSRDIVYNSFINNMKLTIEKGSLLSFEPPFVKDKSLAELLMEGINFPTSIINLSSTMDFKYTLKMDEKATNELENVIAKVDFTFNAAEIPGDNGGGDNGGGDNGGSDNGGGDKDNYPVLAKTETDDFNGDLIDRMPGYIALNKPIRIDEVKEEIVLPFNIEVLRANGGHTARIYYWHESLKKWIALATYPNTTYTVKAINDGGYVGWFNVFGVIQPSFNDLILGHWAEPVTNRMNGLGIIEGYPGDGLIRPAQLEQNITRAEFTTLVYRLLNINPDRQILEAYNLEEANKILAENYEDVAVIPDWAKVVIASATKAGLVEARGGKFLGNEPITRLEAGKMMKKAVEIIKEYQTIDLTGFITEPEVPNWVKIAVSNNVIGQYSGDLFGPDKFITRAEALSILKRLFIIEMGL